jgi:hypothetical protein
VVFGEARIGKAGKTRVWRSIFRSGVGQSTLHWELAIQLELIVLNAVGTLFRRPG